MKHCALLLMFLVVLTSSLSAQIADFAGTDFAIADNVAEQYPNHSLMDISALSRLLTKSLPTEQQKFRAIYTWVCKNIDNDRSLYLKNKVQRERLKDPADLKAWNQKINREVMKQLVTRHSTICTGYAYLLRELALCAGLECKVIDGYGRNVETNIGGEGIPNHSWNSIKLNGKWYLCDATWSAGAYDVNQATFVRNFDDTYFLTDPIYFAKKHHPLDSSWMLLTHKPTLRMFLDGPIVYVAAIRNKIEPCEPTQFNITTAKHEKVRFQFTTSANEIGTVKLQVNKSIMTDPVTIQIQPDQSILYTIDHDFTSKGISDVHIMFNDHYVLSYHLIVK